jgi:hypothetical protein
MNVLSPSSERGFSVIERLVNTVVPRPNEKIFRPYLIDSTVTSLLSFSETKKPTSWSSHLVQANPTLSAKSIHDFANYMTKYVAS